MLTGEVVILEDWLAIDGGGRVAFELVLHEGTPAVVDEVDVSIPANTHFVSKGN